MSHLDAGMRVVFEETMGPTGFMSKIRENVVDPDGFRRLIAAIDTMAPELVGRRCLEKLFVACLFEAPWEIQNTVDHYRRRDVTLGDQVGKMADELRTKLNDLFWSGLGAYDEDPENAPDPTWLCPGP